MGKPRQAVVIIHGIGEQRPMETLRGFVMGVMGGAKRPDGTPNFYSKPDPNAEGFEVRRYRAIEGRADTDFIEFYWQHLMPIAGGAFIFSWLWSLMRRPLSAMPLRFAFLWWFCWAAVAIALVLACLQLAFWLLSVPSPLPSIPKLSGMAAITVGAIWTFVRSYVGDAAIYLNPHPRTVEARNAIRTAGVALIERLQADDRYDRVVLVGHSLGSVIGYDIASFAWHRASDAFRKAVEAGTIKAPVGGQPMLAAAEDLAGASQDAIMAKWPASVRANHYEQKALGLHWLVTDFVTLGSPLAHAALLLARDTDDLHRRQNERELPKAPPFREDDRHFSFERSGQDKSQAKARIPDHAALFSVTTWTNLYFPCRHLLHGDCIGGEVAPAFGRGVRDVAVRTRVRGGWLAHTAYWTRYAGDEGDSCSAPTSLIASLDLSRTTFPKKPKAAATAKAGHAPAGDTAPSQAPTGVANQTPVEDRTQS